MAFPTGWTSQSLRIDSSKVSGTADLVDFPVLITQATLGTTSAGTAIWANSQGQEIYENRFLNDANLQGYWRLEGNGNDSGTNGYNLTAYGTPAYAAGIFGTAVDLEITGSSRYLSIADASCPKLEIPGDKTVIAWVKPESFTGYQCIAAKTPNGVTGWELHLQPDAFPLWFNTYSQYVISGAAMRLSEYNFIAGISDVTNNNKRIWVNGVKTQSGTCGTTPDTNGDFSIGHTGNWAAGRYFDGIIDDVAVFDRALTDAEILEIYNGGADLRFTADSGGTALLSHEVVKWDTTNKLGEAWVKVGTVGATTDTNFYMWYNNATAVTSSSTATWSNNYQAVYHLGNTLESSPNNFSLSGTVTGYVTGTVGSGADFESSGSNRLYKSTNAALNFGSGDFTVAALVKRESVGTYMGIVSKRDGDNFGYSLVFDNSSHIGIDLAGTGAAYYLDIYSTATFSSTTDYYYVGMSRTGSSIAAYVNGTSYLTNSSANNWVSSTVNLTLGAFRAGGDNFFDGIIDEVQVLNSSRTSDWFATNYNNYISPSTFILTSVDYSRAIADSINLTDTLYGTSGFIRSNSDNLNITDTLVKASNVFLTIEDTLVVITDTVLTTTVNIIEITQDIMGITDSNYRLVSYTREPLDNIYITETIDRTQVNYSELSDNIGLTDYLIAGIVVNVSLSDDIGLTDFVSTSFVTNAVLSPIIEFYQVDTIVPEIGSIDEITPSIYNIIDG